MPATTHQLRLDVALVRAHRELPPVLEVDPGRLDCLANAQLELALAPAPAVRRTALRNPL